jgi:hypothetical protein
MLITHTEAISIADYFTLKGDDGKVLYRPTVHFAYHPCPNAIMSMKEVGSHYTFPPFFILYDSILTSPRVFLPSIFVETILLIDLQNMRKLIRPSQLPFCDFGLSCL